MTQINKFWMTFLLVGIFILTCCNNIFAAEQGVHTSNSDSIFKAYLKEHNIETNLNNEVKILKSGHEKFIDLFAEIEKAKHHIHLEYFNFRNDSIANCLFDLLAKKAAEGVEVRALFDAFGNCSNNQPLKKKHLKEIRKKGIEIQAFDPFKFPWINHAFHRDHRKIAIIGGNYDDSDTSRLRYDGCLAAMQRNGIAFDEAAGYVGSRYSYQDGYEATKTLLNRTEPFTALFAMADVLAIGAIRALRDQGLRVPEDVSVMGFDGLPLTNFLVPQLSTVHQSVRRMAARSVQILLDSIQEQTAARHESVPYAIMQRESTRFLEK
jgi:hypothetical protein